MTELQHRVRRGARRQREERRCRWCGRGFVMAAGPGRPPLYCRRSCRQREYEARRRLRELGLSEGELIIARSRLDELQDRLYVLACAVEDVERDLGGDGGAPGTSDLQEALEWLLDAARQAAAHSITA